MTEEEIGERERLAQEEFEERRRRAEAERESPDGMSDPIPLSAPMAEDDVGGEPTFSLIPPEFEREMEQKAAE